MAPRSSDPSGFLVCPQLFRCIRKAARCGATWRFSFCHVACHFFCHRKLLNVPDAPPPSGTIVRDRRLNTSCTQPFSRNSRTCEWRSGEAGQRQWKVAILLPTSSTIKSAGYDAIRRCPVERSYSADVFQLQLSTSVSLMRSWLPEPADAAVPHLLAGYIFDGVLMC